MFSESQLQLIQYEFSDISSVYLNTAYFGPIPKRTQKIIELATKRAADPSFYSMEEWLSIPDQTRESIAKLLGCLPKNIMHSTSTGDIIALIGRSLNRGKKERVALIDEEYPSNVLPWMFLKDKSKVTLDVLPKTPVMDIKYLEKYLNKDTTILNISYISFKSGRKINLLEIGPYLKSKNIILILDATQAFGSLGISEKELSYVDAFVCSTYKWLLSPYGHSFAYLSDDFLTNLESEKISWINSDSFVNCQELTKYSTKLITGAVRFDRGQSPNMLNMRGVLSSITLLSELGLDNIEAYNKSLVDHFCDKFDSKNFTLEVPRECLANIISLKSQSGDLKDVIKRLTDNNIDVSVREGSLRISLHFFNTIKQVELLLETL